MAQFLRSLDNYLNAFSRAEATRLHWFLFGVLVAVLLGLLCAPLLRPGGWAWRSAPVRVFALIGVSPLVFGVLAFADALLIEPGWLETTRVTVSTDRLRTGERLRIALLSDLHVAGWTRLLRNLPDTVNAESPDLVVFTGDSLNENSALPVFRSVLQEMHPRFGRYAVLGNHDIDLPTKGEELFVDGVANELQGRPVVTANGKVVLCGLPWQRAPDLRACLEQAHGSAIRIAVYHSPDLILDAVAGGADLYLAGHTHGGQIRMPFYGAIITMSAFDKRYEAGHYLVGDTALYVNRGIGFEGRFMPIRFLCRPELTIIDVVGTGPAS